MGAWNYQILCDDMGCDAILDLMDSEDFVEDVELFINEIFEQEDDYIESDSGQYGLLAAAVVDAGVNGVDWSVLLDDEAEKTQYEAFFEGVAKRKNDLVPLCNNAKEAIKIIMGKNSELQELWEENEELYPKWKANLEKLLKRL